MEVCSKLVYSCLEFVSAFLTEEFVVVTTFDLKKKNSTGRIEGHLTIAKSRESYPMQCVPNIIKSNNKVSLVE